MVEVTGFLSIFWKCLQLGLLMQENLKEADILMRSLDHKDPELKTGWYSFAQGILLYHENDLERSLSCLALAKRDVLKAELWHEKVPMAYVCSVKKLYE